MSFNADKCFTLHITKKRKTTEYDYKLHDQKLEVTKDNKYLGVTISTDLSWNSHINNIYAKANRTISFLRRNIHSCPKEVKRNAYTTLVRSSVELVRDSSVVRRHYILLLEPSDVRAQYIRKTADLPHQLWVGTFPRFVAIGFY